MQHKRTDEQIQADIQQLQRALNVPNLPNDEREMHTSLLTILQTELGRRMNATQQANPPQKTNISRAPAPIAPLQGLGAQPKNEQIPRTRHILPPSGPGGAPTERQSTPSPILAGGFAQTDQPITAQIELVNNSNKHNPAITITWTDGYTLTVDETDATGRFKSTLRDTLTLKCVNEDRYARMWRWNTPWRASGFYKALTALRDGIPPSLKDLGFAHPSERQKSVFALITEKALAPIDAG